MQKTIKTQAVLPEDQGKTGRKRASKTAGVRAETFEVISKKKPVVANIRK